MKFRYKTYNEVFRTAGFQAHGQEVVPHDVVGDDDANHGPNHGEIRAEPAAQHRGDDREKNPRVVQHQIVKAEHEGRASQSHKYSAKGRGRIDTSFHEGFEAVQSSLVTGV